MKALFSLIVLITILCGCTKKDPFVPRLEIKAEAQILRTAEEYEIESEYPRQDSVLKKPASSEIIFRFTFINNQDPEKADIRAIWYNRTYVQIETPDTIRSIVLAPFILDRQIEIGGSDDFEIKEFDFNKVIVEEMTGPNTTTVSEKEGLFNYEEFIFKNNPDSIATITIAIDYEGDEADLKFHGIGTPKNVKENQATFIIPAPSQLKVSKGVIDVTKYTMLKKK